MKIFWFADRNSPKKVLDSLIVSGENLYYRFCTPDNFVICPPMRDYWIRSADESDDICLVRKLNRNNELCGWDIGGDKVKVILDMPKGLEFAGKAGTYYAFTNSSYTNTVYKIWNIDADQWTEIIAGRSGSLIFFNKDIICYMSLADKRIVAQDYYGNRLWAFEYADDISGVGVWHEKEKMIFSQRGKSGVTISVIDLMNGETLLQNSANEVISFCRFDGALAYIKCSKDLLVYSETKNAIIHELHIEAEISDINVDSENLILITRQPLRIECYNKSTFACVSSTMVTEVCGYGGLLACVNGQFLLTIHPNELERKRGCTWIAFFTNEELLSEGWRVEVEQKYFHVEEQDDLSGGVSLNVTFSIDIDFDTLYRHVSTGLQASAFRNGLHRFTKGKSVNKRFNGTVIANFEGHVFTQEQKELIEDLCNRTTEYFGAGMNLLSGDGSKVCHVTSIIPAPHNL